MKKFLTRKVVRSFSRFPYFTTFSEINQNLVPLSEQQMKIDFKTNQELFSKSIHEFLSFFNAKQYMFAVKEMKKLEQKIHSQSSPNNLKSNN